MTLKRIALITMCVMLTATIALGTVVLVRVSPLVNALMGGGASIQNPPGSSSSSEVSSSQTPPSSSEVPPSQDNHEHEFFWSSSHTATCDTAGYSIYTCACGKTEMRDQVKPLGHSYGAGKLIAATCDQGGYTLRTCSVCAHEERRDLVDPLGHNFVTVVEKEATCTERGYVKTQCNRDGCGEIRESYGTAPAGHDYQKQDPVAPSCEEDGYTPHVCSKCGDVVKEDVSPMLGHSGDWVITKEPAAGDPGEESRTCTNCGETQTRVCALTAVREDPVVNTDHHLYTVIVSAKNSQGQDVAVYTYTVLDYAMAGQVDFTYEEETGLLVKVTIDGQTETYPLEPGNGTLTLPAETE